MKNLLYGVTFKVANGAMRNDAAKEAFIKAEMLEDCGPVYIEFCEKRFRVMLTVREVNTEGQYVGDAKEESVWTGNPK